MTDLKIGLTVISIVALVSGLSLASISIWALNVKFHRAQDWYPQAANASDEGNMDTRHAWDKIRIEWNEYREMNLAAIGIGFASGCLQSIVALILLYGARQASCKTLLGRYAMSSAAIFIVLLICVITLIASDLTNPLTIPADLKHALGLDNESSFLQSLQYGIRAYIVWVIIDLVIIFVNTIVATVYVKFSKSGIFNQLEIVQVDENSVPKTK